MISPVPGWGAPGICGELAPPVPYGKAGCCTAEMRLPAAGGTPYRGTSPPKAERTGRPPVLSYYYALGRKPRKAWKAEGSATFPARAAASAQRQPSAAPGLRRAATAHPPSATPHGRRYAGQCRWTQLLPGSSQPSGKPSPSGVPAGSQSPASSPQVPVGGGAALPARGEHTHTAAVRSAGAFLGLAPAAFRVPEAQAAQNSRAGHSPHRGAPPGRQTIAPSSMSAWVKSPAAPSG